MVSEIARLKAAIHIAETCGLSGVLSHVQTFSGSIGAMQPESSASPTERQRKTARREKLDVHPAPSVGAFVAQTAILNCTITLHCKRWLCLCSSQIVACSAARADCSSSTHLQSARELCSSTAANIPAKNAISKPRAGAAESF